MLAANAYRPGITKGLYPEKSYPDQGWVERAYRASSSFVNRKTLASGIRSRRFINEVSLQGGHSPTRAKNRLIFSQKII